MTTTTTVAAASISAATTANTLLLLLLLLLQSFLCLSSLLLQLLLLPLVWILLQLAECLTITNATSLIQMMFVQRYCHVGIESFDRFFRPRA